MTIDNAEKVKIVWVGNKLFEELEQECLEAQEELYPEDLEYQND